LPALKESKVLAALLLLFVRACLLTTLSTLPAIWRRSRSVSKEALLRSLGKFLNFLMENQENQGETQQKRGKLENDDLEQEIENCCQENLLFLLKEQSFQILNLNQL
jgi:hypothetical protein